MAEYRVLSVASQCAGNTVSRGCHDLTLTKRSASVVFSCRSAKVVVAVVQNDSQTVFRSQTLGILVNSMRFVDELIAAIQIKLAKTT